MASNDLPQPATPLIGRTDEIDQLRELLDEPTCRLLSLVGPGGIGKTRLAIEVAALIRRDTVRQTPLRRSPFSDGCYFVPLQSLSDPNLIVNAIANRLAYTFPKDSDPQQELFVFLQKKHMLLVLDNFEHLVEKAELLSELLAYAPHLKVLVTSRERLRLREEWLFDVGGLTFPVDKRLDGWDHFSAVQLFLHSARRAGYTVVDADADSIISICQVVDGMPLAVELAAAWVRVMPCVEIAREVEHSLDILKTNTRNVHQKHRSMHATFQYSWELLTPDERTVFGALAVFRGGFTREAAEQVAGATLEILVSLVDKSLVQLDASGRYGLHELLRQYAEEHHQSADEGDSARDAHRAYYATFVQSRVEDLKGRRQLAATNEIYADFENVRQAWMWAANHRRVDLLERMLDGIQIYCRNHARLEDFQRLCRDAEKLLNSAVSTLGQTVERIRGRLLARAGGPDTLSQAKAALDIAQRFEDAAEIAYCLEMIGLAAYATEDYVQATALLEQSLAISRELGDPFFVAEALLQRTFADHDSDWDVLFANGQEALRLQRQINDRLGMGWSLALTAIHEARAGNFAKAETLWLERLKLGHELGNLHMVAASRAHISHRVYFFQGAFDQAQTSAEEAIRLGTEMDYGNAIGWALATLGLIASMNERYDEGQTLCQQAIDNSSFADISKYAAYGLAVALCGLGDYQGALTQLGVSLKYLTNILGVVGKIASLPIIASVYAHKGRVVRAVELLALAFTHPINASSWMQKWPFLNRLRAELEFTLGSEVYSEAWKRGTRLNLDDVIDMLEADFSTIETTARQQPRQLLPEPLSRREVEILELIADGLTNREIADQLVIGVSTVKKHIQHIYAKLLAKNRTGAVVRARELNLIP